jgi:hypothetical protein
VAVLFFDTSALVRRYDTAEPGSDQVRSLCHRRRRHILLVATLTPIELASALNRKLREALLSSEERDRRWRLFRHHLQERYRLIPLDELVVRSAQRLLFDYPLRAYDALQLSSALRGMQFLAGLAPDFRFCTADRNQAQAATHEGLSVELIV